MSIEDDTLVFNLAKSVDTDGDLIADLLERGHDSDGIEAYLEVDSDNDGVDDYRDLDSDNGGISDAIEVAPRQSASLFNDASTGLFDDAISDALASVYHDVDDDAIEKFCDLDSDNDDISDLIEGGGSDSEDSVHIGLSGSGCSIASSSGSDPIFWIQVVFAGLYFAVVKRYRKARGTGIIAILVLIGAALSGSIQADDKRGLCLGVGVDSTSLEPGIKGSSFTVDDSSSAGWHALIGYRFHRRWQAELDYAGLGEATLSTAATLEYIELKISVLYNVWKGSVLGGRENLAFFGRLGAGNLSGESSLNIVEDSSILGNR